MIALSFPPPPLVADNIALNSRAMVVQYVDSTTPGSYIENTHGWWCAAGRSGAGFGLFTVQWALIVLRLCLDTETGGISLERTLKRQRRAVAVTVVTSLPSRWQIHSGKLVQEMGTVTWTTVGSYHGLSDDPVRIAFLRNKESHIFLPEPLEDISRSTIPCLEWTVGKS